MSVEQAFQQAQRKYENAEAALKKIEATGYDNSVPLEEYQDAWENFLMSLNGVFSKLEQGSKFSKVATDWYAHVKGKRRTDPVLSYLRAARNSEEHSLVRTSNLSPKSHRMLAVVTSVDPDKSNRFKYKRIDEKISPEKIVLTRAFCTISKKYTPVPIVTDDPLAPKLDDFDDSPVRVGWAGLMIVEQLLSDGRQKILQKE